jgi:hypothetical protein
MLANPALRRDDPRIDELINAEALLRKAQREARGVAATTLTAAGTAKRSPQWVAVDSVNTMVRRLRNDLGIDRLSVKRSEAAGVKVKRSNQAENVLAAYGPAYGFHSDLIPGLAGLIAAHGLTAEDLPVEQRERFRADLAANEAGNTTESVRDRLRQRGML